MLPDSNVSVSILLPVYNGDRYLQQAIESLISQTFQDFELIIINDGSTDQSEKIIQSFSDNRIIYVKNDRNLRLIKTLNKGVDLAKGKFIARMDADDISLPQRLERQLEIFKSHPEVDIVNSHAYYMSEDGSFYRKQKSLMQMGNEPVRFLTPLQNFICHPAVMIKSSVLKQYKYKDEQSVEHIEDFELWNRLLSDGHICHTMEESLLLYRNNSLSINNTQKVSQIERLVEVSSCFLKNQYGFPMSKNLLKAIHGDYSYVGLGTLNALKKELDKYTKQIQVEHAVSKQGHREIKIWEAQKMFLIALRSLKGASNVTKAGIVFFLFKNGWWFYKHSIADFILRSAFVKIHRMA